MRVIVPYTPVNPKSRLASILRADERRGFAAAMLADVVAAIENAGFVPEILSTAPLPDRDFVVHVDERSLSTAVNSILSPPMTIVMADLGLLTPAALDRAIDTEAALVIGPGRGGGTNLLVVRADDFVVDYHGNSLNDHRQMAAAADIDWIEVDSFRIATDIDEPSDLVEVLLHGRGRAPTWLREHGIGLSATDGRVTVDRASSPTD